jgi:hypothetical protein
MTEMYSDKHNSCQWCEERVWSNRTAPYCDSICHLASIYTKGAQLVNSWTVPAQYYTTVMEYVIQMIEPRASRRLLEADLE